MGLAATTWVPMAANDNPNPSQRRQKDVGKGQNPEKIQPTEANLKTAKSSPARAQRGDDRGHLEFGTDTPGIGYGVHVQEKNCAGPGSKLTHRGQNTQKNFDPIIHPQGFA